jgi:hypothetical protein
MLRHESENRQRYPVKVLVTAHYVDGDQGKISYDDQSGADDLYFQTRELATRAFC